MKAKNKKTQGLTLMGNTQKVKFCQTTNTSD